MPPPYYPPPRSRSNTGPSMKQPPIPIPAVLRAHRYVNMTIPSPMEVSETHMDELCKSVTEHALEGTKVYCFYLTCTLYIVVNRGTK